jgi:hypothetical protein
MVNQYRGSKKKKGGVFLWDVKDVDVYVDIDIDVDVYPE